MSEVSLAALFMLLAGQALWLTYGLTRPDLPMIVANVVAVTVTSSLIVVESEFQRRRDGPDPLDLRTNRWRSVQPLDNHGPRNSNPRAQVQPPSPNSNACPPAPGPVGHAHTRWRSVQPLDNHGPRNSNPVPNSNPDQIPPGV